MVLDRIELHRCGLSPLLSVAVGGTRAHVVGPAQEFAAQVRQSERVLAALAPPFAKDAAVA
jgi:hypothetical protein